ncbi:MAG: DUF5666 domain-containing protein [Acidimicrobiales bacterium]
MQVQNPRSGEVTVSWTSSTAFSKRVTASAANLTAGACVAVIGSTSAGQLTANSVTIGQPSASGACTSSRGGGGRPGGFRGGTPPNGSRGSRPPGSGSNLSFATGKVTSASATSLVLLGTTSSGPRSPGSTSSSSAPSSSITVSLGSSTIYSETQSATSGQLAVGDCVTANGSSDSTGAITARSVAITSTGGQTCSTGFGRGGGAANG